MYNIKRNKEVLVLPGKKAGKRERRKPSGFGSGQKETIRQTDRQGRKSQPRRKEGKGREGEGRSAVRREREGKGKKGL